MTGIVRSQNGSVVDLSSCLHLRPCANKSTFRFYMHPVSDSLGVHNEIETIITTSLGPNGYRTTKPEQACVFVTARARKERLENSQQQIYPGKGPLGQNHVVVEFDLLSNYSVVLFSVFCQRGQLITHKSKLGQPLAVPVTTNTAFDALVNPMRQQQVPSEDGKCRLLIPLNDSRTVGLFKCNNNEVTKGCSVDCVSLADSEAPTLVESGLQFILLLPSFFSSSNPTAALTEMLLEAVKHGVIPVLVGDLTILPFADVVPWQEAVINITRNTRNR